MMGDFNAHIPAWYSQTTYALAGAWGILITEFLTTSDLLLLNLDSPNHLTSRRNPTFPEPIIASYHIALDSEWCTLTTLNSDHLEIIAQLQPPRTSPSHLH